jgi:hypothetical protein
VSFAVDVHGIIAVFPSPPSLIHASSNEGGLTKGFKAVSGMQLHIPPAGLPSESMLSSVSLKLSLYRRGRYQASFNLRIKGKVSSLHPLS